MPVGNLRSEGIFMETVTAAGLQEPDARSAGNVRPVIAASSLGTLFEWYDFFIYGTLAASGIIGRIFFPPANEQLQTLLAWAGFAVGFGFRPLGAMLLHPSIYNEEAPVGGPSWTRNGAAMDKCM